MAGGCASNDATFSVAPRLVLLPPPPPIDDDIVSVFMDAAAVIAAEGINAVVIRLIATTCERDCIFCCSGSAAAPTAC